MHSLKKKLKIRQYYVKLHKGTICDNINSTITLLCKLLYNNTSSMSSSSKKPGLIIFDLDYTLWPFWVDTHVTPPFSMKGSKIVDAHSLIIKHYPEVPQVFEFLKNEGIPIAAASRTGEISGANQLLNLFEWDKYFKYKEIYPGCKLQHFKRFQRETGLPYSSMIFFDDEERNIRDLRTVGVHCVFVKKGVDMKLVKDALQEVAKNV